MKKKNLLFLSILSPVIFAQQSNIRTNLGVFYSQRRIYRGALTWDAPIMAIAPSFIFFNKISLGQGGLSYFNKFNDYNTFTIGLNAYNDNRPGLPAIRLKDDELDYKNLRKSSTEPYLKYDFRFRQYIATSFSYHKEIKEHYGDYFNLKISTSIIPFITLGTSYGNGDSKHNKYVYGPEGASGYTHQEKYANLTLPFIPWQGRLMINYHKSKILKETNVQANYIRGKKYNENFSLALMWNL